MNTVPARPPDQAHDNRKRPRGRLRPALKPRPKPGAKRRAQKTTPAAGDDWFTIRDIIAEKSEHGCILYLVDWDGTDRNGRRYKPTWEPAANVTAFAINAWRDKKNEEASKAADASWRNQDSLPLESTQETDPVQAPNRRRQKRGRAPRGPGATPARSSSNVEEGDHEEGRTDASPAASHSRVPPLESKDQFIASSGRSDPVNPVANEPAPTTWLGAETKEAHIVVELPRVPPAFDPSEFQIISPSQSTQASSQATLPDRMRPSAIVVRDQRVIPDSQEISGTSASEAHNSYPYSYPESAHLFAESQPSQDPPAPQQRLDDSPQPSFSSGIPSHQPDSRLAGISGFFTNPNLSTNPVLNSGANQNHNLSLHIASAGPFQRPVNESSPVFQTQLELDFDTLAASSPLTTSHSTTIPASLQRPSSAQTSQEFASQLSYITYRASTPGNSQAAQIVQPLISHSIDTTFQSQSASSVFGADRTGPETVFSGERGERIYSQRTSRAISELGGNSRISPGPKGHERASSAPQQARPSTPTNMDGTSAHGTPLSAKERFRLLREEHFSKPSVVRSGTPAAPSPTAPSPGVPSPVVQSPAAQSPGVPSPVVQSPAAQSPAAQSPAAQSPVAPSPVPLDNVHVDTHAATPQAQTHDDSEKASIVDTSARTVSPMLPLMHEPMQAQIRPLFESEQAHIDPNPPHEHILTDPSPPNSYNAPHIEPPGTLDPSTLTLSIENDADGSPSVVTDDGFASGPVPESTNSDEDDIHTDYPRSLLPLVPTGPCEYLVTLPFQTSSRPQYNDIIRENEELIHDYNFSFRVIPHETPRKDIVEKLDHMFSRLLDICDFPPFLDSLASMSPEQITKHVIGTNSKFSFVAEMLDNLRALNSNKKVLIFIRPGKLMDLLGHVIRSKGYRYVRSGQEVVGADAAKHPLTVYLSSTSDEQSSIPIDADVVIAFDHTFHQDLVPSTDQGAPVIILALVNTASIQHLNMRIMESLQPLERKNVLMLALVKAMRFVEEPDPSESLFSIAEKFARRIQIPEEDEDDFYWEPQSIPNEIFDDLYAGSSQIDMTQFSGQSVGIDQYPGSRKRSHVDDDNDEGLAKRPKIAQPQVIASQNPITDVLRNLFGGDLTQGSDDATVVISIDKLHALSEKFAELESKLQESKAREAEFRQLSDRAQKEVEGYVSSINNIQKKYMDALEERGIFEADCKTAQEQASVLTGSLESCRTEIATLKATRTELQKKLAEANDSLLDSSNPDVAKAAELEKNLNQANAEVQGLKKKLVVMQSDLEYSKNMYSQASQRAAELSSENRSYEKRIEELQRRADENVVEVNKVQSRNEVRILAQQVKEQKTLVRERVAELNRAKEELKALKSGRRETRQSSVPRSPRLSSLGVMSPRNGTRGPSAMGGPSSSRGTSPQPPVAVFDGPAGSGNGVQNAALFNQGPGANRFAHLRD
ncbi:hypothetical protein F4802DRAFT_280882 [Xylaria palmicola]|nr:hypothetical protein F4802DRAFT_280882 [Xylaria palmicola]